MYGIFPFYPVGARFVVVLHKKKHSIYLFLSVEKANLHFVSECAQQWCTVFLR